MSYRNRVKRKWRNHENVFGGKTVYDWLYDRDRPEEMNYASRDFFLELKDVDKRLARNNTILYFLIKKYDMNVMQSMLISTSRIRGLISALLYGLKGYRDKDGTEHPGHAVTQEWIPVFQRTIKGFEKRCDHVFLIIKKDLEETELYPYFQNVGFDRLVDFAIKRNSSDDEQVEQLVREIAEWNAEHPEEVNAYMASIADRIHNRDEHRKMIKEQEEAEKWVRRNMRKQSNAELREMRQNNRAHEARKRKIERSFERYYK